MKRVSMEKNVIESLGSAALDSGRLDILGKVSDDVSSTTKAQYYFKDLEVVGALAFTHQNGLSIESQHFITPIGFDVTPRLTARKAFLIAKELVGDNPMRVPPTLKILPNMERTAADLVYVVDFATDGVSPGADVVVDANTGRVISHTLHVQTAVPIDIFNNGKSKKLFIAQLAKKDPSTGLPVAAGCITLDPDTQKQTGGAGVNCDDVIKKAESDGSVCEFLDGRSLSTQQSNFGPLIQLPGGCDQQVKGGKWASDQRDPSVKEALANAQAVADYYSKVHGRESFDGKGAALVSYVNSGLDYSNAFWSSESNDMHYGAGDGVNTGNFARFVDISGHEMTHGVVSRTAALEFGGEPGALNEAIADFFGKMIENKGSWQIGKGVMLKKPNWVMRDLADPASVESEKLGPDGKKWVKAKMPAKYDELYAVGGDGKCTPANDACFVHDNSTIPSHAFYLMFQSLGKEKAEKVVYQGLTKRLTSRSNFHDAAKAMKAACRDTLKDEGACKGVDDAWAQVGL